MRWVTCLTRLIARGLFSVSDVKDGKCWVSCDMKRNDSRIAHWITQKKGTLIYLYYTTGESVTHTNNYGYKV